MGTGGLNNCGQLHSQGCITYSVNQLLLTQLLLTQAPLIGCSTHTLGRRGSPFVLMRVGVLRHHQGYTVPGRLAPSPWEICQWFSLVNKLDFIHLGACQSLQMVAGSIGPQWRRKWELFFRVVSGGLVRIFVNRYFYDFLWTIFHFVRDAPNCFFFSRRTTPKMINRGVLGGGVLKSQFQIDKIPNPNFIFSKIPIQNITVTGWGSQQWPTNRINTTAVPWRELAANAGLSLCSLHTYQENIRITFWMVTFQNPNFKQWKSQFQMGKKP